MKSTQSPTTCRLRRRLRALRRRTERGAALVEFALVAMPLFLILFGTIEFGWAFFQLNDIRHGAREGLRLVVVASDISPDNSEWTTHGERLAQATCERMDRKDGVTIEMTIDDLDEDGFFGVGDDLTVVAHKDLDQLTMVFDPVLEPVDLREVVTSRMEQDPPSDVHNTMWGCR